VYFEGFRLLRHRFEAVPATDDPRTDLLGLVAVLRAFVRENAVLAEVMFSRPFADFDPGPDELVATRSVREFIVGQVRRCIHNGQLAGDEVDIAHVLLGLAQGLALQETAGWLGRSQSSVDRRWQLAFRATLDGLAPRQSLRQ
jgi:hypothetical protein